MTQDDELVPVVVLSLLEEPIMHSPVVILHDPETNRVLPIWIGDSEARAISIAYQNIETSRPLTHSLLLDVTQALGGEITHVAIEAIEGGTYYARIYLVTGDDQEEISIDARPSDCIALALELDAPIYVFQSVLDRIGQPNPFPFNKKSDSRIQATPLDVLDAQIPPVPRIHSDFESTSQVKETFSPSELKKLADLLNQARGREFGGENKLSE